jgi:hypothetical protein
MLGSRDYISFYHFLSFQNWCDFLNYYWIWDGSLLDFDTIEILNAILTLREYKDGL